MDLQEIRRERLRALIELHSAKKLAARLGYTQTSFLTQMTGPNPTREITEKSARRFEDKLGLPRGHLDMPLDHVPTNVAAPAAGPVGGVEMVADVIRLVGSICAAEHVELTPVKFADVVALAYVDTIEHQQVPRPDHIAKLVRLLK